MNLTLSVAERLSFQHVLPLQGDYVTLATVDSIIKKVAVSDIGEADKEFLFDDKEATLLRESVHFLNSSKKLNYQAFSLVKKILFWR